MIDSLSDYLLHIEAHLKGISNSIRNINSWKDNIESLAL